MLFTGGYQFLDPPPQITADGPVPVPSDGARKLNSRIAFFYPATGTTPAMCMRLTGIGSQYLIAMRDSGGEFLDGDRSYRLTLPPGIPESRFWSVILYDNQTRSVYRPIGAMELASPRGGMVPRRWVMLMGQTARFQETLRRLAMIDEGFVKDEAQLGLGLAGTSALDPKTAALLQLGVSVATGSSAASLEWSTGRALAAGATGDEIADVLLVIAPVAGLGRVVRAAPDVAIALGYDIEAALEEPKGH